jgi:hypothetical protein
VRLNRVPLRCRILGHRLGSAYPYFGPLAQPPAYQRDCRRHRWAIGRRCPVGRLTVRIEAKVPSALLNGSHGVQKPPVSGEEGGSGREGAGRGGAL